MTPAEIVEVQLGRPLRSEVSVVVRCPLELPVVIRVPPILDDGTPFPTTYWLTCPLAQKRIGRLEGLGGVKQLERYADHDEAFGAALAEAHRRYGAERDTALPGDATHTPSGGVAGTRVGVKCIHAHYADHAAGNENPVGAAAAPFVEPLDCDRPCVVEADGAAALNPRWREPR